jgi:hypothetical protein
MNSTVQQWKYAGKVSRIGDTLVFPPVSSAHGLYWFSVTQGAETIAGYVGKAGGRRGLAQRFGNYKRRAVSPRDQHGKAVPLAARDHQLGATSINARRMLRAIGTGQTVSVFIIDDSSLADKAALHRQEKIMIGQLCRSGVVFWNVAGTGGSK